MRLHHVQVACPRGAEDDARRFYADGLGLTEVEKPAELAARGGAWFRSYDATGAVAAEVHVGVEDPFTPARKAHPALVLDSPAQLEAVGARLVGLGFEADWSQRDSFPGHPAVPHLRRARQPGRAARARRPSPHRLSPDGLNPPPIRRPPHQPSVTHR